MAPPGPPGFNWFFFFFFFFLLLFSLNPLASFLGLTFTPNFNSYSGYINVDRASNRNMFYFFSESQRDPKNDPVVLWLTGGPGCSSLSAMLSENSAFRPDPNDPSKLIQDNYSWNRVANVIWLESPAGVGFSYSDNKDDYNVGDVRTANDTYTFLLGFFTEFPQFQKNKFYVTGESYGV